MKTGLILVLLAATGLEAGQVPKVEITVSDRLGISRAQEAVCSGIPFGKGELAAGTALQVETAAGGAVATQTRELGYWPDGSVQWMLVQFLAECPAQGQQSYVLREGVAEEGMRQKEAHLRLSEATSGVEVHTGPLLVKLDRSSSFGLGEVRRGEKVMLAAGSRLVFELEDGTVHTSDGSRAEVMEVEEAGPVRGTVHVAGWLQDAAGKRSYKLDTRYRFYAGQSTMRVDTTFICLGEPKVHRVKSIYVEMRPQAASDATVTLPGGFTDQKLQEGKKAVLGVDRQMVCRVGWEDKLTILEKPVEGWVILKGKEGYIGAAVEDFYHLNPKAIEADAKGLRLALWSERGGEVLRLGRTRAKTHRVLLSFETVAGREEGMAARLKGFAEPLIAQVSPEYFCGTSTLGTLSPAGVTETAEYDAKVRGQFEYLMHDRMSNPRENCMLHYGDYYQGGYGNVKTRGNLEYDTGHGCFLLYARSGDRDYYNFAVSCNQHFIDMDIDHDQGGQRYHGYSERAEQHEEVYTSTNWGHVFVDCCADGYYLTGDERSLEALRLIADDMAGIIQRRGRELIRSKMADAERNLGWPLLTLCRAFEVTRDPKYLQAAKMVVDYIKIYARDPLPEFAQGVWWRTWMMDGCKPFMTGELHNGLSAYSALTGDEELRGAIVKSLDWLLDHMWNPQMNAFVYEFNAMNRKNRNAGVVGLNFLVVDAFRYGYELTGDERYLSVAVRAFVSRVEQMESKTDAKQFSEDIRTSPHTAAYLQRKGIRLESLPPSPQPVRQAAPPAASPERAEILLQADFEENLDFQTPSGMQKGEKVGEIQFVPGKEGRALATGKGGYVRLPAPREMLMGPGTVELWLQLHTRRNAKEPAQAAVFHVEGETPLIDSLGLVGMYNELRVRMKDHVGLLDGTAEGDVSMWEPGQWHHAAVTWDEKRVKLYLDGKEQVREEEGNYPWDSPVYLPSGPQRWINLGWRFGNWYGDCTIDSLQIYGRALTAEEIGRRAERQP